MNRIDKEDMFPAHGCTTFCDGTGFKPCELLGKLRWVGYGGGTEYKSRISAVKRAYPSKPSENLGHVRTHDSAVGMDLVNHHDLKGAKKLSPFLVMRQERKVYHFRVCQKNIRGRFPYTLAMPG